MDGRGLDRAEIGGHQGLLLVLAAAEEDDVASIRVEPVPKAHRHHLDLYATPARPLSERDYVAPIAVDVHQIGIEMAYRQLDLSPPRSERGGRRRPSCPSPRAWRCRLAADRGWHPLASAPAKSGEPSRCRSRRRSGMGPPPRTSAERPCPQPVAPIRWQR